MDKQTDGQLDGWNSIFLYPLQLLSTGDIYTAYLVSEMTGNIPVYFGLSRWPRLTVSEKNLEKAICKSNSYHTFTPTVTVIKNERDL